MESIFLPNVKPEEISSEYLKKILHDVSEREKIELLKSFKNFQTSYMLKNGSPKTLVKKVY